LYQFIRALHFFRKVISHISYFIFKLLKIWILEIWILEIWNRSHNLKD